MRALSANDPSINLFFYAFATHCPTYTTTTFNTTPSTTTTTTTTTTKLLQEQHGRDDVV